MEVVAVVSLLALLSGVVAWVWHSPDPGLLRSGRGRSHGASYCPGRRTPCLLLRLDLRRQLRSPRRRGRVLGVRRSTSVYRGCMVALVTDDRHGSLGADTPYLRRIRRSLRTRVSVPAPFFFLYKGLTSDGHYATAQLIALGVVASALRHHEVRLSGERLVPSGRSARVHGGPGALDLPDLASFLGGSHRLARPLRRPEAGRPVLSVLGAGALLGATPWWLWNLQHGCGSVTAPETGASGLAGFVANLWAIATTSAAVMTGAEEVNPGCRVSPFQERGRSWPPSASGARASRPPGDAYRPASAPVRALRRLTVAAAAPLDDSIRVSPASSSRFTSFCHRSSVRRSAGLPFPRPPPPSR